MPKDATGRRWVGALLRLLQERASEEQGRHTVRKKTKFLQAEVFPNPCR